MDFLNPYKFYWSDNSYKFKTEYDLSYSVYFRNDIKILYSDYPDWCNNLYEMGFDYANNENRKNDYDPRISDTIIMIVDEFFKDNKNILLYVCDTFDNHELSRSRLFTKWYNKCNNITHSLYKLNFESKTCGINYISSIILHNSNTCFDEITKAFISVCKEYFAD